MPVRAAQRRAGAVAGIVLLIGWLALPADVSRATLSASRGQAANTLVTQTWYFLHNSPSPPTANTAAVANLAMNATPPTQATLYNYDTAADSLPGRRLLKSGTGADDTTLTRYANWRTATLSSAKTVTGTVTLRIWCGVTGFPLSTAGSLVVYLRDFNPTNSKYTEIANSTLTDPNWQAGAATWVEKRIAVSVSSYSIPSGHQLEVKLEATAAAAADMVIAYDTIVYPSALSVP